MAELSNVTPLFTMDKGRLLAYEARLRPMEDTAEELRQILNTPAALETAGGKRLIGGILVVLLAITIPLVSSSYDRKYLIGVLSIGSIGVWLIASAIRAHLVGKDIRRRAVAAQSALESRDGFLWRFETLLLGWINDLPEAVSDSLRETCQASKDGSLKDSQYALRAYWYWVSALVERMRTTVAAVQDEAIVQIGSDDL